EPVLNSFFEDYAYMIEKYSRIFFMIFHFFQAASDEVYPVGIFLISEIPALGIYRSNAPQEVFACIIGVKKDLCILQSAIEGFNGLFRAYRDLDDIYIDG